MKDKIKQIMELSEKHSDHEIIFVVNGNVVDDDSGYWLCKIGKVEIEFFWKLDDEFISGEDNILENLEMSFENEIRTYQEINQCVSNEFERLVKKGDIKKAIIVYLEQG